MKPQIEFSANKLVLHNKQLTAAMSDDLSVGPVSLEVSLTSSCPIDCVWCVDRDWRCNHSGVLEKNVLIGALKEFSSLGTKGVVLEGGGEPTAHPDFEYIVKEIKKIGLAVGLITNGTLYKWPSLVPSFEWVRVSLDASTRDEYVDLKKRDLFDSVMSNIEMLVANKGKDTVIGVGYLLSSKNTSNLVGIVKRLKEIGVDYVQFRRLDTGSCDLSVLDVGNDFDGSEVCALADDKFNVYWGQVATRESYEDKNLGLPCRCHALSSVISQDGSVFFCCRLHSISLPSGESLGVIGNINSEPVKGIWNGEKRRVFAESMRDPKMTTRWCPSCRMTKYNVLVEGLRKVRTGNFI